MNWFTLFADAVGATSVFRRKVELQLRQQFVDLTGRDLTGFTLVPPDGGPSAIYLSEGALCADLDLVVPDGLGLPVSIAWRASTPEPSIPSEVTSDSSAVLAWWRALPVDELRSKGTAAIARDDSSFSFEIIRQPTLWPDVWLLIETGASCVHRGLPMLVEALAAARDRWNRMSEQDSGKGIIHNLGTQAEVVDSHTLLINVDFGSAEPAALDEMFVAIQGVAPALDIRRVTYRDAPS